MLLKTYVHRKKVRGVEDLVSSALEDGYLDEDLTSTDFDSREGRFFDNSVTLNRKVFRRKSISFRNSESASLSNVVFLGDLILSDCGEPLAASLDNCIICGKLVVCGRARKTVTLNDCNVREICLYNTPVSVCSLSYCTIGRLDIHEATVASLSLYFCRVHGLSKYRSRVASTDISGGKIDSDRIIRNQAHTWADDLSFHDVGMEEQLEVLEDPLSQRAETLSFLLSDCLLPIERRERYSAEQELTILAEEGRIGRWLVSRLAGFRKPHVFIIAGIVQILGFATFYSVFELLQESECRGVSFFESLYFSGVTFATIGYGDITPLRGARAVAVLEGLLGILTCSAYLVALVNRFTRSN